MALILVQKYFSILNCRYFKINIYHTVVQFKKKHSNTTSYELVSNIFENSFFNMDQDIRLAKLNVTHLFFCSKSDVFDTNVRTSFKDNDR